MCGRVAQALKSLGVLVGEDGYLVAFRDLVRQVDFLAVHDAAERGLREAGADGCGYIGHRGALLELLRRAVG